MSIIIETERLILREFEPQDAAVFYKLNEDIEVIQYTGDVAFHSLDEAISFFKNYSDYKRNGFGRWSVVLKSNQEVIGWCGLKLHDDKLVDIGYRFFKKYWSKGYATESAAACIKYGFNELNLSSIIGRTMSENIGSVKVLEKIGLKYLKTGNCDGLKNALIYSISNKEK